MRMLNMWTSRFVVIRSVLGHAGSQGHIVAGAMSAMCSTVYVCLTVCHVVCLFVLQCLLTLSPGVFKFVMWSTVSKGRVYVSKQMNFWNISKGRDVISLSQIYIVIFSFYWGSYIWPQKDASTSMCLQKSAIKIRKLRAKGCLKRLQKFIRIGIHSLPFKVGILCVFGSISSWNT